MSQAPQQSHKSLEIIVTYSESNGRNVYTIIGMSGGEQIFLGHLANAAHPLPIQMMKDAHMKVKLTTLKPAICRSGKRRR